MGLWRCRIVLLFGLTAVSRLSSSAGGPRGAVAQRTTARCLATTSRSVHCGGPRTIELYDAFGEQGDDEDEPDEHTGLRARSPGATGVEVGFHEGFLNDEDPKTLRTALTPMYRDEPEKREAPPRGGSGDGSWEHAS
ncbi:hypothetical protein EDB85DRAFT_1892918 [Lactarius pseudohatsudake]|nr:hypothetical protein EDB85DRAFT_1892918 [Lactarius pseudohatsudake]